MFVSKPGIIILNYLGKINLANYSDLLVVLESLEYLVIVS